MGDQNHGRHLEIEASCGGNILDRVCDRHGIRLGLIKPCHPSTGFRLPSLFGKRIDALLTIDGPMASPRG